MTNVRTCAPVFLQHFRGTSTLSQCGEVSVGDRLTTLYAVSRDYDLPSGYSMLLGMPVLSALHISWIMFTEILDATLLLLKVLGENRNPNLMPMETTRCITFL